MFEVFEHTADLGLRVRADSLEQLFVEAGRGLLSLIVTDLNSVRLNEERTIRVDGIDREYLLFDWLTELLVAFESDRLFLVEFEVQLSDQGLTARCRGETLDDQRHQLEHEVKAITYHGLRVERAGDQWMAELIVDI